MKTIRLMVFAGFLGIIAGCASLNQSAIENMKPVKMDGPELKPGYELYEMRIDVIRAKTEEDVTDSTKKEVDKPYHPLGFDLGNGLFYDINQNLSFKVLPLFGLMETSDFDITYEGKGFVFKNRSSFIKTGDEFTREESGGVFNTGETFKVSFSDTLVSFAESLAPDKKIVIADGGMTYYRFLDKKSIQKEAYGYSVDKFIGKDRYTIEDNTVNLDNKILIKYLDDRIEVYKNNFFGAKFKYTIIRSGDEIYCYDKKFRGFHIFKTDNRITIEENKDKIGEFILH